MSGLLKAVSDWSGGQWSQRGGAGEGLGSGVGMLGGGQSLRGQGCRVQGGHDFVWARNQQLGVLGRGQCVGKGLQRPGGRVWGRARAGVALDGNSAGMCRECWSGKKGRGRVGLVGLS